MHAVSAWLLRAMGSERSEPRPPYLAPPCFPLACLTLPTPAEVVCVVDASRRPFQANDYGCWVGGGTFVQLYSSHDTAFGGWDGGVKTNDGGAPLVSQEGKLWLNLPGRFTLILKQIH